MFYPGDPVEQRKQMLLKKLGGGGRSGRAGGGFRVGRQAGQFGGGMRAGQGGQGQGLPGMLQGYGQGGGFDGGGQPQGLDFGSIQMQQNGQHPFGGGFQGFQGLGQQAPVIPQDLLQKILGGYGQQAQPYPNAGFPTRGFGVN